MKVFGLVIGTALALAGCATGSVWDKPGGTQQSFAIDKYNCMKRRPPPLVGLDQELYAACMELPITEMFGGVPLAALGYRSPMSLRCAFPHRNTCITMYARG